MHKLPGLIKHQKKIHKEIIELVKQRNEVLSEVGEFFQKHNQNGSFLSTHFTGLPLRWYVNVYSNTPDKYNEFRSGKFRSLYLNEGLMSGFTGGYLSRKIGNVELSADDYTNLWRTDDKKITYVDFLVPSPLLLSDVRNGGYLWNPTSGKGINDCEIEGVFDNIPEDRLDEAKEQLAEKYNIQKAQKLARSGNWKVIKSADSYINTTGATKLQDYREGNHLEKINNEYYNNLLMEHSDPSIKYATDYFGINSHQYIFNINANDDKKSKSRTFESILKQAVEKGKAVSFPAEETQYWKDAPFDNENPAKWTVYADAKGINGYKSAILFNVEKGKGVWQPFMIHALRELEDINGKLQPINDKLEKKIDTYRNLIINEIENNLSEKLDKEEATEEF